jgi:hypothetical protein
VVFVVSYVVTYSCISMVVMVIRLIVTVLLFSFVFPISNYFAVIEIIRICMQAYDDSAYRADLLHGFDEMR